MQGFVQVSKTELYRIPYEGSNQNYASVCTHWPKYDSSTQECGLVHVGVDHGGAEIFGYHSLEGSGGSFVFVALLEGEQAWDPQSSILRLYKAL